jgi:hypothetical protein
MIDQISQIPWWALLGIALPPLVGFVTKRETSSGIQGVLFTGLAAVLGVIVEGVQAEQAGHSFAWATAVGTAVVAWVVGQVSHMSIWQPSGIAAWLQDHGFSAKTAGWAQGEADMILAQLRGEQAATELSAGTGQPVAPAPDLGDGTATAGEEPADAEAKSNG